MKNETNKKLIIVIIAMVAVIVILGVVGVVLIGKSKSKDAKPDKQEEVVAKTEEEDIVASKDDSEETPEKEVKPEENETTIKDENGEDGDSDEGTVQPQIDVERQVSSTISASHENEPFYGIWVGSSGMYNGAEEFVISDTHNYPMHIFLTSEWSNLNPEPYWVVSIGRSQTKEEAEDYLKYVKEDYPKAYVKYSGEKIENNDETYYLTMYSKGDIELRGNEAVFYAIDEETDEILELVVDKNTIFDKTCDTEFFDGYKEGEGAYEWVKRMYELSDDDMYALALSGIFEVSLTGNHIDKFFGCYWWD